jgi:hypothetical protein
MRVQLKMKSVLVIAFCIAWMVPFAQTTAAKDSVLNYKKRLLEHTEIDLLTSFYTQDGNNAAVTGGIGTEDLQDYATNLTVSIPLNADDVLSIDGTVSAYTSASSSNVNPFMNSKDKTRGTPWVASSGASKSDTWINGTLGYAHSSDDRNNVYSANISIANEYDYKSFGFGGGYARQFNKKNTELGITGSVYLDRWNAQTPMEIRTYVNKNGDLNSGIFKDAPIYNELGVQIDKNGPDAWKASKDYMLTTDKRRSYTLSLNFTQILTQRSQLALFGDLVIQNGWLANPMQRVYFADMDNFFMGDATQISNYRNNTNSGVFQLADDIERLPQQRLKIPIGIKYNFYLNEHIVLRSYYRYYYDDWGISAHTVNLEVPVKFGEHWTVYPSYRFYQQTASTYFAPFDDHVSTDTYYTSDYDLSAYLASQFGAGIKFSDPFLKYHVWKIGLKNLYLNYAYYKRNTGLYAHILTLGMKFVADKNLTK